jgi:hypothetical protein
MLDLEAEDYACTFMPVAKCAQRMNVSADRVRQFMKMGVLRARSACGDVLVHPACVPGWTA